MGASNGGSTDCAISCKVESEADLGFTKIEVVIGQVASSLKSFAKVRGKGATTLEDRSHSTEEGAQ